MNPKNTWLWIFLATGLFAFIFFYQRYLHQQPVESRRVLPTLNTATIDSMRIRTAGQREIRVEKTNGVWELTQPLRYPAQATNVDLLLKTLEQLTFATYIPEQELRGHTNADEEFGVEPPQASIVLQDGNYRVHIGHRTPPGDQVYVQVGGNLGIYVVNADWLKLLPASPNVWRDTTLLDLAHLNFNRLTVTNAGNVIELQRNRTNQLWRMLTPIKARANDDKISNALQQLQTLEVRQFVSDDGNDLDTYGLAPPELSVAFWQDANSVVRLDFGKTNGTGLVYARRSDLNGVVAVTNSAPTAWRAPHETFRNPHLFTLTAPVSAVEVHALDNFTLQAQGSNAWRIEPQSFPGDPLLARELISNLSEMQVTEFVKDSVPDVELNRYGLAAFAREYILKQTVTNTDGSLTNLVLADVQFGTNADAKVFARTVGESYVYAISPADFEELPVISWQMRDRQIFNFSEDDISSVLIHQNEKSRLIVHANTNEWSLAPGSQGFINVGGVEAAAQLLGQLNAVAWVTKGAQSLENFGFKPDDLQITVTLKSGDKYTVEIGRELAPGIPYARVTLNNEPWVFAFPPMVYEPVRLYLTIPEQP